MKGEEKNMCQGEEERRRGGRNAIIQEGREKRIVLTIGENACVLVEGINAQVSRKMHSVAVAVTWHGTGCTNTVQDIEDDCTTKSEV